MALAPLPVPKLEGYGSSYGNAWARVEIADGNPRQIKVRDIPFERWTVSWELSRVDFAVFLSWYRDTLSNGIGSFELELDIGDSFIAGNPLLHQVTVTFVQPPTYTRNRAGNCGWHLAATVEGQNPDSAFLP